MTLRSFALPWIATAALVALALNTTASAAPIVPASVPAPVTMSGGRYGDVSVTKPVGPIQGFVVLFSAGDHWTPADQTNANALAQRGAMVVGVDTGRYAAKLAADKIDKTCHKLYGDAEAVSHQLERQQESSQYFAPIAIGIGQGGLLAARLLAQAPANTVAGAVSLDPAATLDPRFAPCAADPTLSRGTGLPGFFEQGVTRTGASAATPKPATAASTPRVFAASLSSADKLVALTAPHLRAPVEVDGDVSDLPLVELPAAHPTDMLAVVISGDGGWRDLDKTIAEALQKEGISVIGWDALRYFWNEKTPEQTSRDLARVLQAYGSRWHAKHIALIGYSFGADVMPFVYNRLPEALRAKVSYMSLLGFSPNADFQVRVTGWLGMPASDKALPVKPEIARVPPSIVQCVYGEKETDTLCPSLAHTGIDVVRTTGDHHFGGNYSALASRIIASWKKVIVAQGSPM